MKVSGFYYDGQSSAQLPVEISFHPTGEVLIQGDKLTINTALEHINIAPRLGNTRRNIFLDEGGKLEVSDNDAIDQLCVSLEKNQGYALLHKLEKYGLVVLLSLLIIVVFIWGGIEYGVPVAAKWVAKSIPVSVEENMADQGVETLDKWLFSDSTIAKKERNRLQAKFNDYFLLGDKKYRYRLLFRNSQQMGANALALPGGVVIVTDALINLAENDQQIIAVLAHEMGHIKYQHGLRSILQNSMTALFMAGMLGDISSVTSLSVTLPTLLVERRYSREFEFEADQYAMDFLQKNKIDASQFASILTLLEQSQIKSEAVEFDYLSSHPAMDKRIDIILRSVTTADF